MSEETLVKVAPYLLGLGVICLLLVISALRESWAMNKQRRATIEEELRLKAEFDQLVAKLQQQPLDVDSQKALLTFCRQKSSFTQDAYRSALEHVTQTAGDATVKTLVIELGRMDCAPRRRDGKPTIDDEQAILNDILNHG